MDGVFQVIFQARSSQQIFQNRLIESMRINNDPEWKSVTYQDPTLSIPEQRWGHSFAKISQNQIVMFGGYGGSSQEGKYLQDLWSYRTDQSIWQKVITSGDQPQARSNYTMHFNAEDSELIIFGGGSQKKIRYNDICILNWQTKIWRKVYPKENLPSPWERTYHTSQFIYPYFIIHGGQSLNCLDLQDMWVFNIESEQWHQIEFNLEETQVAYPCPRRFHSSAFLNNCFYVIGGCRDENYVILGDIYKVDLTRLLQKRQYTDFKWQLIINNNLKVQRWGHSCDVYQDKIFISYGRVSSTLDSRETLVFDPFNNTIKEYVTAADSKPNARRRHSSVMVGNSLLIFGGYNGKYLNDLDYLPLKAVQEDLQSAYQLVFEGQNKVQFQNYWTRQNNLTFCIHQNNKQLTKIQVNKSKITRNEYFKYLINQQNREREIRLQLPSFIHFTSFTTLLKGITTGYLYLSKKKLFQNCQNLLAAAQYFCCLDLFPIIEALLISHLNPENCCQLYQLSFEFELPQLKENSASMYLRNHQFRVDGRISSLGICKKGSQYCQQYESYLSVLCQKMKFDIDQTKLKVKKDSVFNKAASSIKDIFSNSSTNSSLVPSTVIQTEKKKTYFIKFVNFIQNICMNIREEPQREEI